MSFRRIQVKLRAWNCLHRTVISSLGIAAVIVVVTFEQAGMAREYRGLLSRRDGNSGSTEEPHLEVTGI